MTLARAAHALNLPKIHGSGGRQRLAIELLSGQGIIASHCHQGYYLVNKSIAPSLCKHRTIDLVAAAMAPGQSR